ncbi:SusF/SusE family outer membrane protein [Flavobacterium nitratireducens]|uniref:SusF/SusE family outer membrane protein n=1 Tax=Flavobacterium nitratireducens TaxID=992289 RepID=UPI00241513E0|nr:SusF/SusE family outer membrane protein [Flavobacterium nitratireducens]
MKKNIFIKAVYFLSVLFMALLNTSCEETLKDSIVNYNDELKLTVSNPNLVLQESKQNENLTFNWTTGTNQGTSASISYTLQIDKADNNFANALQYDLGVNKFSQSISIKNLNYILLNTFGVSPGEAQDFEAKVIATVAGLETEPQISIVPFTLTPYKPVSTTLFIVGDATPTGWNIANAAEMTPSTSNPGVFVYQGSLSTGSFKLPVNRNGCWCQDFYTRDATDATKIVHNIAGSGDDLKWEITQGGQYKVTVNLFDLTISIEAVSAPPFSNIYIVGDASSSGWNINSPQAFTQSSSNPFIFTYEAHFTAGSFKILAGSTGNWCGEWYRPLTDGQALTLTDVEQNSGCNPDNKWTVSSSEAGRYKITLNTANNTISIQKVNLYIIGDGGPNGWNIGTPSPMTYSNGVYTFTGQLNVGEFKISKFKGDWCDGDWINAATANQSISNGSYIITHGCDGPDNKWKVQSGNAGTHTIAINLDTHTMTIN